MSRFKITVDVLIGTDLKSAVQEAKRKSLEWDVQYVGFYFNGINFSIGRNANVDDTVKQYRTASSSTTYIVSA